MSLLPLGDDEFSGHASHSDRCVLAFTIENVSSGHAVHASGPDKSLYVPAAQAVHSNPLSPVYPVLHSHDVDCALPTRELAFGLHSRQPVFPSDGLYVPATHPVHVASEVAASCVEKSPNPHAIQSLCVLLCSVDENLPASQLTQSSAVSAPSVSKYFPSTHASHALSAMAASDTEYLPATQLIHVSESAAPAVLEYLPAIHASHTLSDLPSSTENVPNAHRLHVSWEEAPGTSEKVPAAQSTHCVDDDAPPANEYFPLVHKTHEDVANPATVE